MSFYSGITGVLRQRRILVLAGVAIAAFALGVSLLRHEQPRTLLGQSEGDSWYCCPPPGYGATCLAYSDDNPPPDGATNCSFSLDACNHTSTQAPLAWNPYCVQCGDGTKGVGEECDAGGFRKGTPECGYGGMFADLFCHKDNNDCMGCKFTKCGDNVVQAPNKAGFTEECDNGDDPGTETHCIACKCAANTVAQDGSCNCPENSEWDDALNKCVGCGNAVVDPGENCDDGNFEEGDGCNGICRKEICGNNVIDAKEDCDDGNTTKNDGCDDKCKEECGSNMAWIADDGEVHGTGFSTLKPPYCGHTIGCSCPGQDVCGSYVEGSGVS